MSNKRILGITVFGLLVIAAVIGASMLASILRLENDPVSLPSAQTSVEPSEAPAPDPQGRVEVTVDTVQAVIAQTLARPGVYSRDVTVQTFWEDGLALYNVYVNVADGITSLRILPPSGIEKRIIVTEDTVYIWYKGDTTPYSGAAGPSRDGYNTADEWQMLVTYEDILGLDKNEITDAGYILFEDVDYIYAEHLSPLLGYTRRYYVSLEVGLVTSAEEYDEAGSLVYLMTAGECLVGQVDPDAFVLPDGTVLWG